MWRDTACGGGSDTTVNGLGLVADPNTTNWTAYFGDYFLPGAPQKGWALQVGSNALNAYTPSLQTAGGSIAGLTGGNTSYIATATGVSSTWEGVFDSIKITQVASIDTGDYFVRFKISLSNLSVTARDSIYYMRTVDPDNEETIVGISGFTTINKIEHQMPGDVDSVVSVSATGSTSGVGLALATKDQRARCCYFDAGLVPAFSPRTIYNYGTSYIYNPGPATTADVGMALLFYIPHLATVDSANDSVASKSLALHPANNAVFSFVYSFKPNDVLPQLGVVHPVSAVHEPVVNKLNIYLIQAMVRFRLWVYRQPTGLRFMM